jgi:hypothetical protein
MDCLGLFNRLHVAHAINAAPTKNAKPPSLSSNSMPLSIQVSSSSGPPQLPLCSAADVAEAISSNLGPEFVEFSAALVAADVDGKRLSVLIDLPEKHFDAVVALLRRMHSGVPSPADPLTPFSPMYPASRDAADATDSNFPLLRGIGLEPEVVLGRGGFGTGGPHCHLTKCTRQRVTSKH